MLQAGQYRLVLQEAERHAAQPDERAESEVVWLFVGASWAAAQLRRWGQAVRWAERGLAMGSPDQEACGKLHFYAGCAAAHTGDLFRAKRELRQYQQLAEHFPRLARLDGPALYMQAYVARALNDQEEEIRLFTEAAEAYREAGIEGQALACRYEVGWSHLLAGRPDLAKPELDATGEGLQQVADPELEVDLAIAWALYESLNGRLEESDQICEGLRYQPMAPQRLADLHWILGSNALRRGEWLEAADRFAEAYDAALEYWWPPQIERIDSARRCVPSTQFTGR